MSEKYKFEKIVFIPLSFYPHQALFSRPATRGIKKFLGLKDTVTAAGDNLDSLASHLKKGDIPKLQNAYDKDSVLEAVAALRDFHRRKDEARINRSYGA